MDTKNQKTRTTNWSPLIIAALVISLPLLGLLQEQLATGCMTLGTKEQSQGLSLFIKKWLPTITLTPLSPVSLLEGGQIVDVATSMSAAPVLARGPMLVEPFPNTRTAFFAILRGGFRVTAADAFIRVTSIILGNLSAPIAMGYFFPSGGQALLGIVDSFTNRIGFTYFLTLCYSGTVHWFPQPSRVIGSFYKNSTAGIGFLYHKLTGGIGSFYNTVTGGSEVLYTEVCSTIPALSTFCPEVISPVSLIPIPFFQVMGTKLMEILFASSIVVSFPVPFMVISVCAFIAYKKVASETKLKKDITDIIIDLDHNPTV